jgi:hypothetical protein
VRCFSASEGRRLFLVKTKKSTPSSEMKAVTMDMPFLSEAAGSQPH